jgi:hypothetical protein
MLHRDSGFNRFFGTMIMVVVVVDSSRYTEQEVVDS